MGGGFVGLSAFLGDAQGGEECSEPVAAAVTSAVPSVREAGGVDHTVIGQGRGGIPVLGWGFGERICHDVSGDAAVGREVQHVPGVVIEPADDIGIGRVGESDVREIGLPEFVRAVRGEATPG